MISYWKLNIHLSGCKLGRIEHEWGRLQWSWIRISLASRTDSNAWGRTWLFVTINYPEFPISTAGNTTRITGGLLLRIFKTSEGAGFGEIGNSLSGKEQTLHPEFVPLLPPQLHRLAASPAHNVRFFRHLPHNLLQFDRGSNIDDDEIRRSLIIDDSEVHKRNWRSALHESIQNAGGCSSNGTEHKTTTTLVWSRSRDDGCDHPDLSLVVDNGGQTGSEIRALRWFPDLTNSCPGFAALAWIPRGAYFAHGHKEGIMKRQFKHIIQ